MKQNLITDVVQGMLPYLNNAQIERLQEVLQHTLFDYEVTKTEKDKEISEQNLVESFLSAKRIEGCSEKTLKYYEVTIQSMLGYLAIEATTNQAICGMICNSKADAAYLYFSLIQSQAAISRLSNGGAQDNLSKNFIDNIKIVVPSSEFIEKLNLATIVEQMTLNTKEIALLEELQATALAQLSSR